MSLLNDRTRVYVLDLTTFRDTVVRYIIFQKRIVRARRLCLRALRPADCARDEIKS